MLESMLTHLRRVFPWRVAMIACNIINCISFLLLQPDSGWKERTLPRDETKKKDKQNTSKRVWKYILADYIQAQHHNNYVYFRLCLKYTVIRKGVHSCAILRLVLDSDLHYKLLYASHYNSKTKRRLEMTEENNARLPSRKGKRKREWALTAHAYINAGCVPTELQKK